MSKPALRAITTLLAAVYFLTNVSHVHATEASIWSERKSRPALLASLPASLTGNLPPIQNLLPRTPSLPTPSVTSTTSPNLKTLLESISLKHGTIQEAYDAGNPDVPPVVLIQDVHLNFEAQTNIAALLQQLIDDQKIGLVGVEGAFSPFDFRDFRVFPDKDLTRQIAADVLEKNLIAAPTYVGITSRVEPPLFIGIDHPAHYRANVMALLEARDQKRVVTEQVARWQREVTEEKIRVLSPELRRFDALQQAHRKGDLGLGAYINHLSSYGAPTGFALDRFIEAYEMERSLHFDQVDRERRRVIERLAQTLSERDIQHLVAQSLAYRTGRLGFGAYYRDLKNLCQTNGIDLRRTPALDNYIRYVLLSDGIQVEPLFADLRDLEDRVRNQLAKTDSEKELMRRGDRLSLTAKLIDFALTPADWADYKSLVYEPWSMDHRQLLSPFESFYEEADARSRSMIDSLLARPESGPRALVMGGFHSPYAAQLLRDRRVSYAVVSPRLTQISGSGSAYLSVFDREKTPLDRLFAGEKLFLASAHTAVGSIKNPSKTGRVNSGIIETAFRLEQTGERSTQKEIEGDIYSFRPDNPQESTKGLQIHETLVVRSDKTPPIFFIPVFLPILIRAIRIAFTTVKDFFLQSSVKKDAIQTDDKKYLLDYIPNDDDLYRIHAELLRYSFQYRDLVEDMSPVGMDLLQAIFSDAETKTVDRNFVMRLWSRAIRKKYKMDEPSEELPQFIGGLKVLKKLSNGGTGNVYLVEREDESQAAVKVARLKSKTTISRLPNVSDSDAYRQRNDSPQEANEPTDEIPSTQFDMKARNKVPAQKNSQKETPIRPMEPGREPRLFPEEDLATLDPMSVHAYIYSVAFLLQEGRVLENKTKDRADGLVPRLSEAKFDDDLGVNYLLMDLVEGTTLRSAKSLAELNASSKRKGEKAGLSLRSVIRLADAVAQFHEKTGLIHNDIKPNQFIVTMDANGEIVTVKIVDMASAIVAKYDRDREIGDLVFTEGFRAPERENELSTFLSDVYSLAVTIEMVAAKDLPQEAKAIIDRCMNVDPSKRLPAREMTNQLERVLRQTERDARRTPVERLLFHPLTAVFTETMALAAINAFKLPDSNDPLSILIKTIIVLVVALILTGLHHWADGDQSRGAFGQRFLGGGFLLIAPIVFFPGWDGILASGVFHLIWNTLYLLRGRLLQIPSIARWAWIRVALENIRPLSIKKPVKTETPIGDGGLFWNYNIRDEDLVEIHKELLRYSTEYSHLISTRFPSKKEDLASVFYKRSARGKIEVDRKLVQSLWEEAKRQTPPLKMKPPSSPDDIPETIGGLKIIKLLANGGLGRVFLAERETKTTDGSIVRTNVVVKTVRLREIKGSSSGGNSEKTLGGLDSNESTTLAMEPMSVERYAHAAMLLRREADVMNETNKLPPGLVPRLLDQGFDENLQQGYLMIEYVEGKTLWELERRLTLRDILRILIAVLIFHALTGFIHNDLKPEQFIVTQNERGEIDHVWILDMASVVSADTTQTKAGHSLSTTHYKDPNRENSLSTQASDIHSLAVMFGDMAAGNISPKARAIIARGKTPTPESGENPISGLDMKNQLKKIDKQERAASRVIDQFIRVIVTHPSDREARVKALLDVVPTARIFGDTIGQPLKALSGGPETVSLNDVAAEIKKQAANGDIDSERLADLLFIFRCLLSDGEYLDFVGTMDGIAASGDVLSTVRGSATWVDSAEQAKRIIKERLLNSSRHDRLVVGFNSERTPNLIKVLSADPKIEILLRNGRLIFRKENSKTNLLSFVKAARAHLKVDSMKGLPINVLILEGTELPDGFLDYTSMSIEERKELKQLAILYLITQTFQAIRVDESALPSWHQIRQRLIHA